MFARKIIESIRAYPGYRRARIIKNFYQTAVALYGLYVPALDLPVNPAHNKSLPGALPIAPLPQRIGVGDYPMQHQTTIHKISVLHTNNEII